MKSTRINYKNAINLFIIIIALISFASIVYLSVPFYLSTIITSDVKISDTVYSENILINFSSTKSTYTAGERAVFYLDVTNLYTQPIWYIEFSLDVTYNFFKDIPIYHEDSYSTRLFRPKVPERLQTLPSDAIEVDLPEFLASGYYTFELEIRPIAFKPPPKASITIFIQPKKSLLITPLITLAISTSYFGILISGLARLNNIEERTNFSQFSLGQRFLIISIYSILFCAYFLAIGSNYIAERIATLVYFLLVIGVINLIWEMKKSSH